MKIGGKKWKAFMAKLYGLGAAVVIIGAMFKIQHWPGAGPMLVVGLTVEAIIFIFSAFEPPHEDPDWSLVYPELAAMHGGDDEHGHGHGHEVKKIEEPESITQELDRVLEEAKIGPELLESLGTGLRNLSDQASKLTDITDASLATDEYVKSVKHASEKVDVLSESYAKASETLTGLSLSNAEGQNYGEQLMQMSKNLSELNAIYELQLRGASESMAATNKFYDGLSDLMRNLHDSADNTKRYKEEVSQLAENLSALNTVYGNMLNAMNYNKH